MAVRITINGRQYGSLDEVPEPVRHLLQDQLAGSLERAKSGTSVRTTTRTALTLGRDLPVELQPALLTPEDYRRSIESQQSGTAPSAFRGEDSLWMVLVAAMALCVLGFFAAASANPIIPRSSGLWFFFTMLFCVIGLIGLWYRGQSRALHPVLVDLASRLAGGFVAIVRSQPRLFFARAAWHGSAGFDPGSKYRPSYSRIDAHIQPSAVEFELHTRTLLARLGDVFAAPATPTGNADFDRHFAVSCRDSAFTTAFLDVTVRGAIERLRQFGDLSIAVHGNTVRVNLHRDLAVMHRKSKRDRDENALDGFLTDACAIVDAAARIAPGSR